MWGEIVKRLPRFPSAVLTGLDASGDAVSVRCQPTVDHQAQVLRVLVPDGLGIVPGPAGLLCHLRLLRNSRRTAKRYLAARGLAHPTIPWEHYAQLKNQARVDDA